MKTLFIYWKHPIEPLGIMYLSAALKEAGHKTKLVAIGKDNIEEVVMSFKPDIIAASIMTGSQGEFINLINSLKKKHDFFAVMGGIHPTFYPDEIKAEGLDCVILGEAEEALVELANSIENKENLTKIPNIWVKIKGKVFKNEKRPLEQHLDKLPFADREIVYEHEYWKSQPIRHFIAGRGCPYKCTYCFNHAMVKEYKGNGNWVRWRSVDKVIEEIKDVLEKYGGEMVYFQDDTFILNRQWLNEFFEKYPKSINKPFHCHIRANLVDEDMAKNLGKAGCYSVHMAIEAGNDHIRNDILKREMSDEQILNAAKFLRKYQIRIMMQNMIGLPTGSFKNDLETLKINMKCKPTYAWCSIFQPYPGLELTEFAAGKKLLEGDYKDITTKFFETTILKTYDKKKVSNLQKWFAICVDFPLIYYTGLLHLFVNMPRNNYTQKFFNWAYEKHRSWRDNHLYGLKLN